MKMDNLPPDVDEYAIGIEEYEDEKEPDELGAGIEELPLDKYAVGIDFSKKQDPEEGTISEDGEIIN